MKILDFTGTRTQTIGFSALLCLKITFYNAWFCLNFLLASSEEKSVKLPNYGPNIQCDAGLSRYEKSLELEGKYVNTLSASEIQETLWYL